MDPPRELERTFLKDGEPPLHECPSGLIQPMIDGEITSHLEWNGSGRYRIDPRSGAMHSQRSLLNEVRYGSDGQHVYVAATFSEGRAPLEPIEFRLHLRNEAGDQFIVFASGGLGVLDIVASGLPESAVYAALGTIFEMRLSMSALRTRRGERLMLQVTLVRDGLPLAVLPMHGELEMQSSELAAYAG